MGACFVGAVEAAPGIYDIKVDVARVGPGFLTQASFYLPLNSCQSYQYITDYDAALSIPGVVASNTTRLEAKKFQVTRVLRENFLFFPINMRMVLEITEIPQIGTDFVQISGEAKFYKGSWRLESDSNGTLFKYRAESEPDSLMPKAVIEYFIKHRLSGSFEAMAKAGAARINMPCSLTTKP